MDPQPTLDDDTLREIVRKSGRDVDVGTCVMPHLLDDPVYRDTIDNEFNCIVPEHHMKWSPMSAREGLYDFGPVDKVVDWGVQHGKRVKAHTLLWHVTSPEWLNDKSPDQLREAVRRHVYTTVAHFQGRVKSWDVVNEALAPDGSLAKTMFLDKCGVQLYDDVFRWSRLADPNCALLYNDNKVEGCGLGDQAGYSNNHSVKSDAMFELVQGMKQRGVPVDGVGVQAHFDASGTGVKRPPTPLSILANIKRYADIGLTTNISEMDVRASKLPTSPEIQEQAQSEIYHDTLAAALRHPSFEGITFWGFTDKHTWVSDFYYEDKPLLWDTQYKRKKSYYAVSAALGGMGVEQPLWGDSKETGIWGAAWQQPEPEQDEVLAVDANPDWKHEQ